MIVSALPVAAQTDQFQIAYGDTVSDGVPGPGAGNIEAVGAQDIYEFDATAGDDAIFDSVVGNNGVFGWRLVAPDGTVLVDSFNVDRRLTLPVTGTYTFTVRGFQANTTGVYSFRLLLVPPPQMFAINIGDTISNGVPSSGAGNLEVPGAVDIYTFDGAAGGGIIFDALIGNTGLARVILTAPDGTQLFSGFYLDQQATFSQSGTYTIRVEGLNITSTGIYSFQLLNIAVPQIFTISIGEIVSDGVPATGAGNLEVPGAIDIYSFDGVANQVMIFDALAGNTGVFRVILTAPDGSEIVDDFYLDRQVTLPQTGTYNLQISGSLVTNFGVYSFQLINVPPGAEEFTINIGDTVSDGVPAVGAGNLEVPGAVDVYNFDGVTGQETIFEALVGDTGQFRIVLTAPDGTELFDDFYQDQQVTLPQTGIYNLRITGGQITIYGTYSFQLLLVPPSAQEFAISIGDTISDGVPAAGAGNLEVPGAVDIYHFDGTAGQNVILDALVGNSGQFRILLTAPDGTTLFDTFYIDQQVSLSQTGSYSLTVYGGSVTNFGVYSFALVDVPNSNPVATDDTVTTDEDVAATIDVLSNDTDVDGDTLSIASVTQPVNGVVVNNGTDVTYTPDANFNGTDSFNYIVSDGNGGSDTATVTVTVNPVNDDPVANDDTAVTDEDVSVLIDVLANDTDIDGDSLSVASVTQPVNGVVANNGADVTYTPNANFNGTDSFNYTVSDGNGGTSTATVNITINPINDNPVANDDTAAADEDVSISINVLSNDTDVDGDQLVVENVTQPANGTVTNNGTDVTYTPNANFNGTDTFTYTVSDGNGGVDTAMVSVTINPVNDSPTLDIRTDPVEVNEGDTVTRAFTTADIDGDLLTVQPSPGTATALGGGSFEWSYLADDGPTMITVTVTVSDGQGGTASATFDLTVVNVPPTADFSNTSGTITAPGSATLSFSGQSDPSQADTNAGFLYSYDCMNASAFILSQSTSASFNCLYDSPGVYTARGRIEDKDGGFADLLVDVTVEAPTNNAPDAQDNLAVTDEDTPATINVLSNDTDADGDPLVILSVTQPTNGIVTNNGTDVTYAPNADFNGTDTFTYTVSDGNGGVDTATVSVTVNPVNDSPTLDISADVVEVNEGNTVTRAFTAADVDGDPLTVQSSPGLVSDQGSGSFEWSYLADDGPATITVTVTVSDGQGGTASASFDLTVVNVPPTSLFSNTSGTITAPGSATLSFSGQTDPSQADTNAGFLYSYDCTTAGTFIVSQSTSASFNCLYDSPGVYTARGRIEDKDGGFTDLFADVIVEAPANNAPDAQDDLATTDEDTPVTINVLSNDTDADGDPLAIESVTQPIHGIVTDNGADVTYTPNANFNGTDIFTYTVRDGNGGVDMAAVLVTVNPVNDLPVSNDDSAVTDEGIAVTINVLANDSDVDGDSLIVTGVTQAVNGTVTNNGNSVTYSPNGSFTGIDTFAYTTSDAVGGSSTATVTVTVNPVGTPGDVTLTLQVSQSSDDVNEDSRFFVANSPLLWIRNSYWGHRDLLGLRFNGVSIPQGATIDEAYVEIYTPFRGWVNIDVEFRADAAGNSPTFDRFNRPSQRTLTTARAEHHGDADWRSRSWNRFNDIAPVIQEVVGRGDWQSGNSLSLIVRGTGQRLGGVLFASYDLYPAFAPRLVISYHLSPIASIQEQVVPQVIEPIAAPTTTPEPPKSTPAIEPPVEVLPTETATIEPTLVPTATPEPTDVPTVEILPTETPTVEPTLAPTPTPEPTQPPTVEVVPTEAPTVEPTLSPTPTPESTQESAMPPLPTLTITADAMIGVAPMAVQFASAATDATDYAWDFGDGVGVSAEANPIYTFTTPGTYIVTLAVSRPGGSASASLTITVTG